MNKITAKIIGNAITAFSVTALSVTFVTEGKLQTLGIVAGLSAAVLQALLAAGKELIEYSSTSENKPSRKKKILASLSLF